MEMNKIFAAILTSALMLFGMRELGAAVYSGHGGHHGELHLAYEPVDVATLFDAAGAEGAAAEPEADLGTLLAAAPASDRSIAICKSCHSFDKGGANGTGPNLWDIVGREVASVAGYSYSGALQDFGGEWTYERLDAYLENSQGYVPGTAMNQKHRKPEKRAAMLAYLQTLSDSPVPFPEPAGPIGEETVADE
ncbi:MAG: c-type cytochrome [Pseudomonadota bacterium]